MLTLHTITGRKHLNRTGKFYQVFDFFAARPEVEEEEDGNDDLFKHMRFETRKELFV